jgi:hypothetical protein
MQLWQSKPIQAIQVTPSGMETDEKLKNITIHDSSKPPSSQHSHRGFLFAEGFNSRDLTHFLMFPTHRIHGAAIPLVTWIPSTKTPFMSAYIIYIYIPAPWIRHGYNHTLHHHTSSINGPFLPSQAALSPNKSVSR